MKNNQLISLDWTTIKECPETKENSTQLARFTFSSITANFDGPKEKPSSEPLEKPMHSFSKASSDNFTAISCQAYKIRVNINGFLL